jgi:flagella basal body P-ring formation protein FlgA
VVEALRASSWGSIFGTGAAGQASISGPKPAHFKASPGERGFYSRGVKAYNRPCPLRASPWLALLLWTIALPGAAQALSEPVQADLQHWAQDRAVEAGSAPGARVEVTLGQLDPRLKLAPCQRIDPYLPPGSRPWGRTRVGLRCVDGPTRWNVYLPVTVQVFAPALVLREPLPAGAELSPDLLTEAEVDWAERSAPPWTDADALTGRRLARALAAGEPLRDTDLQARVWFSAGERVRVTAVGAGFRVSTQAQALSRGLDGRSVRVRTDSGRVLMGTAVAAHQVELPL